MANKKKPQAPVDPMTSSLLEHIQEMISTAVNEFISALDQKINMLESKLTTKLEAITKDVSSLKDKCDQVEKDMKTFTDKSIDLERQLDQVKLQLQDSIKLGNHNEQYSRRWLVRVFGVKEETDESCTDKVLHLFNETLKITPPITPSDLEAAHRIGPIRRDDDTRPRPIIVRFARRDRRYDVLSKRRDLENTGFSIFEDITRRNLLLLNRLRNSPELESSWYVNGKVKAKHAITKQIRIVDLFGQINEVFKK